MKKLILVAAVSLFSVGAIADEGQSGFYVGGKFGVTRGDAEQSAVWSEDSEGEDITYSETHDFDSNMWGLQVGYSFNEYLSAEIGYTSGVKISGRSVYGYSDLEGERTATASSNAELFSVALLPQFPVNDNFSIHGKVGYTSASIRSHSKLYDSYTNENEDDIIFDSKDPDMLLDGDFSDSGLLLGLGATYNFDQTFVRAEYERVMVADGMNMFTLGFGVRF